MGFHFVAGASRRVETTKSVLPPTTMQNILLRRTRYGNDTLIVLCVGVDDRTALATLDEIRWLREEDKSVASVNTGKQIREWVILYFRSS